MVTQERIENDFTYHPPDPKQIAKYERIRDEGKSLANMIIELCPESREQSTAITRIEEAVFWANAAIARHD